MVEHYGQTILKLTVHNCNFSYNSALNGSAIYNNGKLNISDTIFENNKASSYTINSSNNGPVQEGDDLIIKITLLVGNNIADAIYNNGTIMVDDKTPQESCLAKNQEITVILNDYAFTEITNDDGIAEFVMDTSDLNVKEYTYEFLYIDSNLYTGINNNSTVKILKKPDEKFVKKGNDDVSSKNKKHNSNKKSQGKPVLFYLDSKNVSSYKELKENYSQKFPSTIDKRM